MRRRAAALALAALAVLGTVPGTVAQPTNHIGGPLARIFAENGCRMTEPQAAEALLAAGWFISDFQAQALALSRGGYLVSAGGEPQVLQLVNWPPCG